jgi:short-subunit dehydrogenase
MRRMSTTDRRVALVTGASAGIGAVFAEHLAGRGFDLVLTARRLEALREIAERLQSSHGINCRVIPADLADPESPRRIKYELARDEIDVDVLVNNAGYGLPKPLDETNWPEVHDFMEVMAIAWLHFIRLFAPPMVERGWGRIANIASLAAFAPEVDGALYSGVKAQMLTTSRGLHRRFRGSGVHCTAICPGFTYSEFHKRLGMPDVADGMPRWMWQSAEAVVAEGWAACERNRPVVVTGTANKVIRGILAVIPTPLAERLTPRSIENIRTRKATASG